MRMRVARLAELNRHRLSAISYPILPYVSTNLGSGIVPSKREADFAARKLRRSHTIPREPCQQVCGRGHKRSVSQGDELTAESAKSAESKMRMTHSSRVDARRRESYYDGEAKTELFPTDYEERGQGNERRRHVLDRIPMAESTGGNGNGECAARCESSDGG